ncbi:hypothetical protein N8D56_25055 (plasmid) [Devosia sp. A8/3-2]|nr:hypothetical protein N8D56_25055 [Devosia sp. A8/3-2]
MGDYTLVSPDRRHEVVIRYVYELPHGDSYHTAMVDSRVFPGHFWGTFFAFTPDSSFFAGTRMPDRFDRVAVVINLHEPRYFMLPASMERFTFDGSRIISISGVAKTAVFRFTGDEEWIRY